jgi:phosphoglycerate dehydrogenase-like enzyme
VEPFRVGVSSDFQLEAAGILEPVLDGILGQFPFVHYQFFPVSSGQIMRPEQLADFDAIISLRPRYVASSFEPNSRLALIARWGAGYDVVDVGACTAANVLLATTGDAVARPVAEAIVTLFLALAKKLFLKDHIVRTGRWDRKAEASGLGLTGKVVGSVGLGNIATKLFGLLGPFGLGKRLAHDPYVTAEAAAALDVELVSLETLFSESDFIAVNCPLTPETRGLVDARLLAFMKPTAYFVNTARGAIVNLTDLVIALSERRIAGAGLDVFEEEPLPADHPVIALDNVILSPHGLAWTDDLYQGNSVGACQNVLTVLRGEIPKFTVNRDVLVSPVFKEKLERLAERWQTLERLTQGD